MNKDDHGTVRHGSDPNEPPLDWFVSKRHGHSAAATQRLMKLRINFFRRWLNDDLSWVIYEDDNQDSIGKKQNEWGKELLQHENEIDWTTGGDLRPNNLSIDDSIDYFQTLSACPRYGGAAESAHVQAIRQFYEFALNRGHSWFTGTGNPIELALNEGGDKIIGSASPRNPMIISVDEMGEYIRSFSHPLLETICALLAKTTIRRGTIHNFDLQDIYLDHPACNWDVHRELRHKERPFIYVSSEPEEGKLWEHRQRVPEASNKTSVDRTIPVDDEIRDLLLQWLTVHPRPLEAETPLFVSTYQNWGKRLHPQTYANKIRKKSEELGYWYGAHDDDNINPHYFRHWSTSVIDERLEAGGSGEHATTTKLLRGDQEDTMDNYTHWSDDRIERYLNICPKFYG